MMTKRTMTKKFMRETGADKKTAMDYLRKNNWNYGKAIGMYRIPEALPSFKEMVEALSEGLKNFAESLKKNDWNKIKNDWNEAIKKSQEERGESNEDTD